MFWFESERDRVAKEGSALEFKKLYSKSFHIIKNENTGEKWDEINRDSKTFRNNPMAINRINIIAKIIHNNCKPVTKYLLDIGFGSAILERKLKKMNTRVEVSGMDVSKQSVKNARKEFPKWKFQVSRINMNFKITGKYDIVTALEILEHLEPYLGLKTINNIHNVLNKEGLFILSVPINEGLREKIIYKKNINSHLREYTESIIKRELQISGFQIMKTYRLYAFHNLYRVKSLIVRLLGEKIGKYPNNLIIVAKKK